MKPFGSSLLQPVDDKAEVSDFLPPEFDLEGKDTLSPDWQLAYLNRLHLTMEDSRFLTLPPTAQLLYLHLIKRTYGVGTHEVRASVDQLVSDTQLAWMTVQKQLKTLKGVGLVTTSEPARHRLAPMYLVHWLPQLERPAEMKALVTRADQFDAEDCTELTRLLPLLSPQDRENLVAEIQLSLREVGLIPSSEVVMKLVRYRLLTTHPYHHRLRAKHPDWFHVP